MTKLMFTLAIGVFLTAFAAELLSQKKRRARRSLMSRARELRDGFLEGFRGETRGLSDRHPASA